MVSTYYKWTPTMDQLPPSLPGSKTRRKHSPAFKATVLKACNEPGSSTARVAQHYQINANLIHKWRRQLEKQKTADFITLPTPIMTPAVTRRSEMAVRIELPNGAVVRWPVECISDSVLWLKAMLP